MGSLKRFLSKLYTGGKDNESDASSKSIDTSRRQSSLGLSHDRGSLQTAPAYFMPADRPSDNNALLDSNPDDMASGRITSRLRLLLRLPSGFGALDSPAASTPGTRGTDCTGGGHGEAPPSTEGGLRPNAPPVITGSAALASPLARRVANSAIHKWFAGDKTKSLKNLQHDVLAAGAAAGGQDYSHSLAAGGDDDAATAANDVKGPPTNYRGRFASAGGTPGISGAAACMLAELVQDQEAQRRRRHGRQQQQLLLQQQQLQSGTSPPVQRYASSGHVMAFTASAPHAHVATAAAAAADGSHAYDATAAAAAAAAADGHHDYATNSAAAHLMIDAQRSLPSPPGSGEPSPLQAEIAYGPRSPTQGRRRTLTRIYPASGCGGGPESPTPPAIGRSLSRYARASATSIASANGPASPTAQMGPTAPMRSAALSPERHSPATYVADEYGLDTTESLNTSIFTKAEAEAAVAAAAVIPPPSGTTPPPPPPPGMMGLRVVASAGAACSAAAAPAAAAAATAAAGGGGGGTAGSAAVTASSSIYAAPTPGPASATSGSTRWSAASAQGYSGGSSASASTSTGNSLGSDKSSLGSATCYRSSHTGVSAKAAVDHAVVQRRTLQHVSASVALDAEAAATTKPPPASAAAAPPAAAGAAAAALAHPTGGTEKDAASPAALATPPPPPPAVDPAVQPAPAAAAAPATEQAGSPFATARAVATSVAAVANIEAVAAKPTTATTTKAAAEPVAAAAASAAADAAAIAPVRTRLLPPAYDITPGGPFEAHPVPADGMIFVSHLAPPAMTEDRCGACWATSDFEITRKLHAGYASSVFKATCLVTNTDVVLKAYNLSSLSTFLRHQVLRELDIHARLVHPSVVQLYSTFKEGNLLVLVQEYVRGGSLDRVRRKLGGRMTEFQAMHLVLLPLLNALVYLHGRGIVHRDIKPENLLFTPEWQLKLCDFGVSICLHEERAVTKTGSKEYMAPEVVVCPLKRGPEDNKENEILAYTPAVDVWSLGALMYELLVGFTPFPGGPPARTGGGDPAAQLRFPSSVGEPARAFVRSCLQLHPGDRPTIPQLMKDRWVQIALETQQQQQLQDQQQHAQVPKLLAD